MNQCSLFYYYFRHFLAITEGKKNYIVLQPITIGSDTFLSVIFTGRLSMMGKVTLKI